MTSIPANPTILRVTRARRALRSSGFTLTPLNSGTIKVTCGSFTMTVTVMPFSGEIKVQ